MKRQIQIGTRSSQLALLQAESVREFFSEKLPESKWELALLSSPGDRDKAAALVSSPTDFFTRDLDEALLAGKIDCAVHSAKDLPNPLPEGIDFFWLPNPVDSRDVLVGSLEPNVIGVSSERRIAYAKEHFPNAECKPLRGTIEERLAQLDAGEFDGLIMAAAALQRLGFEERITEWISADDLLSPDGQGTLALTFRADDKRFLRLRSLFVKPVVFVSAGTSAGLCTQAGVAALRRADVCLYDALMDPALLNELPATTQKIYVGKQYGRHSHAQSEICELLARFARQGKRVVRLKGGDAGLFGRLAEEMESLDALQLPHRVIPGVSSLSAATTGTGLLLTRRGVADRVRIISGHSAEEGPVNAESEVIFMGTRKLAELAQERIAGGADSQTPAAVVFSAGRTEEKLVFGTLETIASRVANETGPPGLILIGPAVQEKFGTRAHGALRGQRVWLTCSDAVQERAAQAVLDFGGMPVQQPLIELVPEKVPILGTFDWLIVTSPSAVRCLISQLDDLRKLPKILCCGIGTAKALEAFRIQADAMPEGEFNSKGVLEAAQKHIPKEAQILRVRSDRAGEALSSTLRETFDHVEDVVICRNEKVVCEMPVYDAVFFASVSAVESFAEQFGVEKLARKEVVVIGKMDASALRKHGIENVVAPKQSTVEGAVEALALYNVRKEFAV